MNHEYPFLSNVSNVYDEFINSDFVDTNEDWYNTLCHSIIKNVHEDEGKYKYICKKLMRNLEHYSINSIYYEIPSERCNILFHWLYTLLDNHKITYPIIDKCFEMYDDYRLKKLNPTKRCLYYKNDKFVEPTKITLLDIFNDNMPIIITTLKNPDFSISVRGRNFVCECVKIYNHMNKTYCPNGKEKEGDYKSTCLKLNLFNKSYKQFLDNLESLYPKIPSLDDKGTELSEKCTPYEKNTLLRSDKVETHDTLLGKELPAPDDDSEGPLSGELRNPLGNGDNSMKKSITTTIGTVAGASSLLALLYKVNTKIHLNIRTIIYKCVYTKYT
ncbi:hypothetical protein PVBG_04784 [Plasmodium vivax Brazil I]|uniref:Variable surface protein n=1 Tax=Plasmodium vivax (strain Brazil I) TaxID=1033975 RepID=A0A0J9SZK8_PLAV1|nr:hypothetical protein PVBG_04784 [Plasmodium vivax Brazil I]